MKLSASFANHHVNRSITFYKMPPLLHIYMTLHFWSPQIINIHEIQNRQNWYSQITLGTKRMDYKYHLTGDVSILLDIDLFWVYLKDMEYDIQPYIVKSRASMHHYICHMSVKLPWKTDFSWHEASVFDCSGTSVWCSKSNISNSVLNTTRLLTRIVTFLDCLVLISSGCESGHIVGVSESCSSTPNWDIHFSDMVEWHVEKGKGPDPRKLLLQRIPQY